jgi:hypothetical protein
MFKLGMSVETTHLGEIEMNTIILNIADGKSGNKF